jgi:transposase
VGEQALRFFGKLYEVEREVQHLTPEARNAIRQQKTQPIADALHQSLTRHLDDQSGGPGKQLIA